MVDCKEEKVSITSNIMRYMRVCHLSWIIMLLLDAGYSYDCKDLNCTLKEHLPCDIITHSQIPFCEANLVHPPNDSFPAKPRYNRTQLFPYVLPDNRTVVGLNISWKPVKDGSRHFLKGFFIKVIKISHPVGKIICAHLDLSEAEFDSSKDSELIYHYSCFEELEDNSVYQISVASLPVPLHEDGPQKFTTEININDYLDTPDVQNNWRPTLMTTIDTEEDCRILIEFNSGPTEFNFDSYIVYLRRCNSSGCLFTNKETLYPKENGSDITHSFSMTEILDGNAESYEIWVRAVPQNTVDSFCSDNKCQEYPEDHERCWMPSLCCANQCQHQVFKYNTSSDDICIPQAATTDSAESTESPTTESGPDHVGDGPSTETTIGIAVASGILGLILASIIIFILKKKKVPTATLR